MSNELIPVAKPIIGYAERHAVDRVLKSGLLAQGAEVSSFETEFSKELVAGVECIAVNSGTSGQHLALLASGVKPGDEVIVPSFTFAATANAIKVIGATPIFVDIDLDTFCIDPEKIAECITPKTVAIQPVHLYGHPAEMDRILDIANSNGLWVGEDAAQAHGATLNGQPVGTFGRWGMFSLYPTKNMTSGEGGMVVTSDDAVAHSIRLLRNQGMEKQYENEVAGFNNRMTDIHAAIGRVQLTNIRRWTDRRRELADYFSRNLNGVVVPKVAPNVTHVFHQYTIRLDGATAQERDRFTQGLREEHGVGTGVYYPTPVHRLPSYNVDVELPVTEKVAQEVVSLPVHPSITNREAETIVHAVNTLVSAGA